MAEILTVLTFKSARHIIADGGTESWAISANRARRCAYVVCVRHQQGPYKAEGNEPHKHAFLVGKVSGVVDSSETEGRFRVEISEYAIVDGPQIPLKSASPTQYFPSLSYIGIDEASLNWQPTCPPQGEDVGAPPGEAVSVEDNAKNVNNQGESAAMSVLMEAKKLVADGLHVPLSAVEIILRT